MEERSKNLAPPVKTILAGGILRAPLVKIPLSL
jgi:hypothetical protein